MDRNVQMYRRKKKEGKTDSPNTSCDFVHVVTFLMLVRCAGAVNLGRAKRARFTRSVAAMASPAARKTALVAMADDSEEIETASIVDILRRADVDTMLVSVEDNRLLCKLSRGMSFQADALITDVAGKTFDLIALPGGMPGATRLRACAQLCSLLTAQAASGRLVAAVCASPAVVLAPLGLLEGKHCTAHPAFADKLPSQASVAAPVVRDGQVITSRGPGTSLSFALACVAALFDDATAARVAAPMVLPQASAPVQPCEWRLS